MLRLKPHIKTPITIETFINHLQKSLPISLNDLRKMLRKKHTYYYSFQMPERDGGMRTITPSTQILKSVQKITKQFVDSSVKWPYYLHGGIHGRSVLSNAEHHVKKCMVTNIDIKRCFPSTTFDMVNKELLNLGANKYLAELLSDICIYKNCLPQGAPTSTHIANIVLSKIDREIYSICKKRKFRYSRFIDDITISADLDLRSYKKVFLRPIKLLNYDISKYEPTPRSKRQVVTGLVVNEKIRPTRDFIKQLKDDIKSGWPENNRLELHAQEYGLTISQFMANIRGRINFIKSINKKQGRAIRGLVVKMA